MLNQCGFEFVQEIRAKVMQLAGKFDEVAIQHGEDVASVAKMYHEALGEIQQEHPQPNMYAHAILRILAHRQAFDATYSV